MLTARRGTRQLAIAIVASAACAASGAMLPAGASAADPAGSCPRGYDEMTVRQVLRIATDGFEDAIRAADVNGDRILCVRLLPEPIPLFEPTFLYYDNNRVP